MNTFLSSHRNSLIAFAVLALAFIGYAFSGSLEEQNIAHVGHAVPRSGDSRSFNVSFDHPLAIKPGESVPLSFRISDAATGEPVTEFDLGNEKLMHLIIVNEALTYFDHVHPDLVDGKFSIDYAFPKDDAYRLYIDYTPTGGDEQQLGFTLPVGSGKAATPSVALDPSLVKTIGNYDVRLLAKSFKAKDMASGGSLLVFSIADASSGELVKDLRPYLGAFGHLVMINAETYEYIHAHPVQGPMTDDRGGPDVKFMPMPLDGSPVKPGIYKLFAQFRDSKDLFVVPFTIRIE